MKKCPKCGEQLEEQFEECWKCSGDQTEEIISKDNEPHSPKSKKKKIISTVIIIIGAIIWWSVLLIKNPSKLGPGITLGHLIQAAVIIIITFVIVKIIWRKKSKQG